MKKLILLLSLGLLLTGCMKDDVIDVIDPTVEVPEALKIQEAKGLKLESTITSSEVRMNVKLDFPGVYRVKIRDIEKNLVSQEKLTANEGDNLLKVYVSALENDSYTIELTQDDHTLVGITSLVVQK
jgi:hypothetical protein